MDYVFRTFQFTFSQSRLWQLTQRKPSLSPERKCQYFAARARCVDSSARAQKICDAVQRRIRSFVNDAATLKRIIHRLRDDSNFDVLTQMTVIGGSAAWPTSSVLSLWRALSPAFGRCAPLRLSEYQTLAVYCPVGSRSNQGRSSLRLIPAQTLQSC